jgi:hypothetical protein
VLNTPWYRDRAALRFLALHYLAWLGALSLAWELAHLPLYTIWSEASSGYMAYAVLHCTVGDVLIGSSALALALIAGRERSLRHWRWRRIGVAAAVLAASYTVFSEWLNVYVLQSWAYSERMPVIQVAGLRLGMSPILQWLVIPPVALYLSARTWRGSRSLR